MSGSTGSPAPPGRPAGRAGTWVHAVLDLLLGPLAGSRARLWRIPFRLIGPGSVPLAAGFFAITAQLLSTDYDAPLWVMILAGVQSAAIVASRYRPLIAWAAALASFALISQDAAPGTPGEAPWPWLVPGMFGYCVVQYAVARHTGHWRAAATWAGAMAATLGISATAPEGWTTPPAALFGVMSAAAALIGAVVRTIHQANVRVLEEEQQTAEERARRETLEDRNRIARELHDVVAHHMSVIAVQASTASYRLGNLSPEARDEFGSIAAAARESLDEMRRLLGVLRSEDTRAERAPQPTLGALEQVVDATRRAGTSVEYVVRDLPDLPPSIDLAAYRIVQEALSNVVRHAPGADASVEVVGGPRQLLVRVANSAPAEAPPPDDRSNGGHGLAGMRERVAALDGEIVAGPRADGGFGVEASFPLDASSDHERPDRAG